MSRGHLCKKTAEFHYIHSWKSDWCCCFLKDKIRIYLTVVTDSKLQMPFYDDLVWISSLLQQVACYIADAAGYDSTMLKYSRERQDVVDCFSNSWVCTAEIWPSNSCWVLQGSRERQWCCSHSMLSIPLNSNLFLPHFKLKFFKFIVNFH